jgi:hypothetical protein
MTQSTATAGTTRQLVPSRSRAGAERLRRRGGDGRT